MAHHKPVDSRRRGRVESRARRRLGLERPALDDAGVERIEELIDLRRREPPLGLLLAGLPERQRDAVLARVVDERGYAEIAASRGCSEGAVRQLVSRGLARLGALAREERT